MRTLVKQKAKSYFELRFPFLETVAPHTAGETFVEEKIWMGSRIRFALGVDEDTFVTLPRESEAKNLKLASFLKKNWKHRLAKAIFVGKLFYQVDGEDVC
ncbi:hypothetical protein O9992_13450 [Vibrio lentus]|nr:hypothetical protein [Vibrio lentus]